MKLPRARHGCRSCGAAGGKHLGQRKPSQHHQRTQAPARFACQAETLPGFGLPVGDSLAGADDESSGSSLIMPNGQSVEQPSSMYGLSVPQMQSLGITGNTANLLASEVTEVRHLPCCAIHPRNAKSPARHTSLPAHTMRALRCRVLQAQHATC